MCDGRSGLSVRGIRCGTVAVLLALLVAGSLLGQGSHHDYEASAENEVVPAALLEEAEFRDLNFSRGGRSTAVAGVRGQPLVYYFGGTGGGVYKTTDAGNTWTNVSDGYFGVGSIGAIAVAESDPNVVYVGTGSACPRGNISSGDGMYRSTDAGKSWTRIGLEDVGQIGGLAVHPRDEDLVYVAGLGHIFGPNEERGIFRSRDGGATWEKVLYLSDKTGFVDIQMDPSNPRILYAGAWRAERKPWTLISGGEEGGIYKSTDGGDEWTKLEGGLPEGLTGRTAIAVSPADPDRVWVLIEAEGEAGGLYRSDDAGESFRRINGDARLRQRAWYYTHIYADPKDTNTLYGLNTGLYRSVDGGNSWAETIRVPHGDNHDLWINPDDPNVMINANDGGANVSFNGGGSWSTQMNQATAEIYRVFVDENWPYRVYGSQQDNSTISVPSHGRVAWTRMPPEWYDVAGCESGHIAIDPRDSDVTYAGCYGGSITRYNRATGQRREVIAYPQLQLGQAPRDLRYRFQWNAPIRISPHDPNVVYHTSQVVHRSSNGGQSWDVISPDLSTNNLDQQDFAGGPITRDSTGVEVYNTVFAFEESPHRRGELWAGTDDGRVHVSRDNGESWNDVTPADLPTGATINMIDLSAHDADRIHLAAFRYREDDFRPYVYRTADSGSSWELLTREENGIPATHFTRVVREDPVTQGLLYVGTEFGLYASFDDGAHFQRFQGKLPVSPITDLVVHRGDLIIATQGRSFWAYDDLSEIRQLTSALDSDLYLFEPRVAYRGGFSSARLPFYAKSVPEEAVELAIHAGEDQIAHFEWKPGAKKGGDGPQRGGFFFGGGPAKLEVEEGLNHFSWNLRKDAPERPQGVVHWGFTPGIAVLPGTYRVTLTSGDWEQSRDLTVELWPTFEVSDADLQEQFELGTEIAGRLQSAYDGLTTSRDLKRQSDEVLERLTAAGVEDEEIKELAGVVKEKLSLVEEQLTQVKSKSGQDPLNFPPMLDNQYVELYAYVVAADSKPPDAAYERFEELNDQLDRILADLELVREGEAAELNEKVKALDLPAIGKRPVE